MSVSIRALKNELSAWVHRAEEGERILILREGDPVAALVPLSDVPPETPDMLIHHLVTQGVVRRAKASLPSFRPIRSQGPSTSGMVMEDRR